MAMAKERNIYIPSLSSESNGHRPTKSANISHTTALLFVLCVLSANIWPRGVCSWPPPGPWSFNNTCEEDREEYGSNCEDNFQKILDENSIIFDNSTGIIRILQM